jgi:hypothetical protein
VIANYEVRADSASRAREVALRRAKADGARMAVVLSVSAADPWLQHNLDSDRLNRYLVAVEETFSPR